MFFGTHTHHIIYLVILRKKSLSFSRIIMLMDLCLFNAKIILHNLYNSFKVVKGSISKLRN